MKKYIFQYYVEGDDEKHLINVLKNELKMITPGKVQKLNVVDQKITDAMTRAYKDGTVVVMIFDTDTGDVNILNENIAKLKRCSSVSKIITIPQVLNLEDEIVRSCNVRNAKKLLNSRSTKNFKRDFINVSNLGAKLTEHKFDINLFWNQNPREPYQHIENRSSEVKLK